MVQGGWAVLVSKCHFPGDVVFVDITSAAPAGGHVRQVTEHLRGLVHLHSWKIDFSNVRVIGVKAEERGATQRAHGLCSVFATIGGWAVTFVP